MGIFLHNKYNIPKHNYHKTPKILVNWIEYFTPNAELFNDIQFEMFGSKKVSPWTKNINMAKP